MRAFRYAPSPKLHLAALVGLILALAPAGLPVVPSRLDDAEPVGTYSFSKSERCFLRKINKMRVRNGRARLNPDKQLGYVARRHARRMASRGAIFHDGKLGQRVTRWKRLGQNVGRGGTCKSLFKAFKRSSVHRGNILGRWRHMGVGVRKQRGNVYVMQVFQFRRNPGNIYEYP